MKNNLSFKALCIVAGIFVGLIDAIEVHATQTEQAYTTAYRYENGLLTGTIKPDPDGSGALHFLTTRNNYSAGLLMSVDSGELASFPPEDVLARNWENAGYSFKVYSRQEFHYDSYGRKDRVTSYDKNGVALSLTEYSYDYRSRILCTALRMDLTATGDACNPSNLTSLNPDRITRFTYDDFDQVSTEERAVGTPKQQNYVSNVYEGRFLRYQVDANCNKTELRYDPQWRLSRMVYPSTAVALSAGQTCDKPSTSNSLPNLAGGVNEGDYVEFGYDANGNKNYERKRNGTTINYAIDNNNRVIFKDYSNPNQPDIAYDYDLRGLQTSAKFGDDSGKGITTTYDGFGNVISQTNSMFATSSTLNYEYDLNNNRKKIVHPDGATFNYQFDDLNRITQLDDPLSSNLVRVFYQENGRRSAITRSNGTSTEYSFVKNGVQLDAFKQNFAGAGASANNLSNSFLYNNAGQISQLTLSNSLYYYQGNENRTGVYVPNGLNQYKKVGSTVLDYDANQNLKYDGMTYYYYDDENRLVSMTKLDDSSFSVNLVYDPNGRLFQSTINGTVTEFLYDGDALIAEYDGTTGELLRRYVHGDQVDEPLVQYNGSSTAKTNGAITSSTLAAANATFTGTHVLSKNFAGYTGSSGFIDFVGEGQAAWALNVKTNKTYSISARYALEGSDRPLAVMVDGVQKAVLHFADTKIWSTWSTAQVAVPLTAGNHTISLKTLGASGPNVDYVTVTAQTGTGLYYLHSDHQGSVIAQSDAAGKVALALAYDTYGIPASGNVERFGYTGQIWFKDLGLDYYKARFYSPGLGRFLQTDPIGYKDDMDLYTYVGNDPLNHTDPTGLCAQCIGAVVGGVVGLTLDFASADHTLSWQEAVGSFSGGAVTGAMVASGVPLTIANGVGSAAGEAVTQGANAASGKEASVGKVVMAGVVGAAAGAVPGAKVAGVTGGKGNMAATFKAQMTKLSNGTIDNVSAKTVGKGIASGVVGGVGQQAAKETDKRLGTSDKVAEKIDENTKVRSARCLPANPSC